jgi:F0F1-type ATP synthase gamma subunit
LEVFCGHEKVVFNRFFSSVKIITTMPSTMPLTGASKDVEFTAAEFEVSFTRESKQIIKEAFRTYYSKLFQVL